MTPPIPSSSPKVSSVTKESRQARRLESANRRANLFLVLIPVGFILGIALGYLIWGSNLSGTAQGNGNAQTIDDQAAQNTRYDVSVDDDPSLGPANAPVTIIEFSDYQCPYCEKWNQEVFGQLIQDYGSNVRFVYRDFPLSGHAEAQPAAEAADCAGEQGKYWDFHNKLFSGQQSLGQAAYQQYAGDIGLDLTKFNECVSSRRFQQEVEADLNYAMKLGVSSTPTFFINGRPLIGAQPYASFKQVIDQELSAKQ